MAECFEERRDSRQLRGDGRQQTEFICRPAVASLQLPSELVVMRHDDDDDDDDDDDKDDESMRHIDLSCHILPEQTLRTNLYTFSNFEEYFYNFFQIFFAIFFRFF